MDATQMKLLLESWGASDPSLGDVEGDAYPLRLAGAGPVPVEVDQDPDVAAKLVVRADLSAEAAGDTIDRILDAATGSGAALLEVTTGGGRVRVQHAWYAEALDRHAFMSALAEVNRAVGRIQDEAGLTAAAPASPAAEPAAAVPAAASQPVTPEPVVTPAPTTPVPPVPTPAPAPAVDAAALAAVPAAWRRTHTTAPGARAWSAPNPALPPLMDLAPGTELRVLERLGQWARVDAANGWTGWVDAQLLVSG